MVTLTCMNHYGGQEWLQVGLPLLQIGIYVVVLNNVILTVFSPIFQWLLEKWLTLQHMLLLLLSWSHLLVHLASSLGNKTEVTLPWCCLLFQIFFRCFSILTFFSYSAVLADIMLKEKLHIFGILGCVLCVVGSTTIVLHAPQERAIESVAEVWVLATEPGALLSYPVVIKCLLHTLVLSQ